MPETPNPAPPPDDVGPLDYVVVACPECCGGAVPIRRHAPPVCWRCNGVGLVKLHLGQGAGPAAGGRADG